MEMNDQQYGLPDLRHLLAGRTHFPTFPQQFQTHRNLTNTQHYDFSMLTSTTSSSQVVVHDPHHHVNFSSADSTTTTNNNSTSPTNNNTITTTTPPLTTTTTTNNNTNSLCGFENMEGCFGADGGNGRWPRQETLTLLEIRSRLDSKFKEANQKGPLWDEISRIMAEEHGYQRTGKKCREKFENLYKYYKKTKEGKAGRQDGKHYRFFRQLEALYGDTTATPVSVSETSFIGNNLRFQNTSNNTTHVNHEGLQGHKLMSESLSISNSSFFDTSSSEDGDNDDGTGMAFMENYSSMDKKNKMVMKDIESSKRGRKTWKAKIRDFVDSHMKKLMETQEVWLEKMLKTLEQKEKERMLREEEWRKREAARIDQEHKFWANERAWFEARDSALMEALRKITGKELKASSFKELMGGDHPENMENNGSETLESTVNSTDKWPESDISSLIHLRTSLESSFQQNEYSKETLWEEISARMACLGYDRSAKSCEEKWEDITNYIRSSKECSKKHSDNCFQHLESNYNQGAGVNFYGHGHEAIGTHSISDGPSNCNTNNVGSTVSDSSFRFLMSEGGNLWDNYCVNIARGEDH